MKWLSIGLFVLSTASFMSEAMADDPVTQPAPTKGQMMRDCIRKHEAADVTQSKAALNRICKDELKQQRVTGALPAAPPTDVPHDPAVAP